MRVANPQKDNYAKSPTVRPPRWKVISVAKEFEEYDAWMKEMAWAKLATEICEAILSKCLQVSRRIRRISSTKFASMTDQPDMRRRWFLNTQIIPSPKRLHDDMREAPPQKSSPYCSHRIKLKSHFSPVIKVHHKVLKIPNVLLGNCDAPQEPNQR